MQEMIVLRYLLHLRPRIGNGDKVAACLRGPHNLFGSLKEILLEDIRLERAARFAGNDEQRFRDVDLMFERLYLRGIGGIQNVESRELRNPSERHPQYFRAKARSPHAQ